MKHTLFWLTVLCLYQVGTVTAQTVDKGKYDLRFILVEQTQDKLYVDLQVKSATEDESFKVGSHTIFFSHNKEAIRFVKYEADNFNGGQGACHGTAYPQRRCSPNHHHGLVNLTTTANRETPEVVCPIVTNDWLNFGQVTFSILDSNAPIDLQFNTHKTILNYIEPTASNVDNDPKDRAEHEQAPFTGFTDAPLVLSLQLKAFLSGAYQSGSMKTELRNKGLIPATQPYNQSPWNYSGQESVANMPTNTVDWILVEIRDNQTSNPNTVLQKAALLLADGSIVDANNPTVNSLDVSSLTANTDYYVVIKHRNHLPVMSALPINLSNSSLITYDFSDGVDKAWKDSNLDNEAMKVDNGISLLWGGNANLDDKISYKGNGDKRAVYEAVNKDSQGRIENTYNNNDVNLDGLVRYSGNHDKRFIYEELGKDIDTKVEQHLP